MEDMDSKLNAMLNDPAAMQRIIQMAQQLSGGAAQAAPPPPPPPQGAPPPADGGIGFDPMMLAKFLPLLQDLRQSNSQTTQLLYALRPFLKEEKQSKVERAAKLAHLIAECVLRNADVREEVTKLRAGYTDMRYCFSDAQTEALLQSFAQVTGI